MLASINPKPSIRRRVHSSKLTWKPIYPPFKATAVLIGPPMGFHVSFQECTNASI